MAHFASQTAHSPSPSYASQAPLAMAKNEWSMSNLKSPSGDKSPVITEKEIVAPDNKRHSLPSALRRQATADFDRQMEKESQPPLARFFSKLLENELVRYCLYIIPVALLIAIPLTLFCTIWNGSAWSASAKTTTTVIQAGSSTSLKGGSIVNGTFINGTFVNGALINGTFTGGILQNTARVTLHKKGILLWLELCWAFLWIAKIIATALPKIFSTLAGVVAPGFRKYAQVLKTVRAPLSFLLWAVLCIASYNIIYVFDRKSHTIFYGTNNPFKAMITFHKVLKVSTGMAALWLAEKVLVQLISVSYHARAQEDRIKVIKKTSKAIELLYEASLRRYHNYHHDMLDLDLQITDSNGVEKLLGGENADLNTRKLVGRFHRMADRLSTAFHRIASDLTGQEVMKRTGAHAIVEGALNRAIGAEALAQRIFKALAPSDTQAISEELLVEELGPGREAEAHWIFSQLDHDGNGDVTLSEMILLVCDIRTQRRNLWKSACDIQDAVKVLDNVLSTIVFIIVCLFYAAFFSTFLSTKASTILSFFAGGAFAIANTVGEFNACCMFVFVKHPYDVGDRVNINAIEYEVTTISLLYSVLRRIDNGTVVGIGNQVLSTAFIENVTRSQVMKERIQFSVSSKTSFDDIELLRVELETFVRDEVNSRHFQPDINIELISFGDLKQLDLRVEILHKSNWADERLRQDRRSRFMCGLLSAMRKIPIDGPSGSGPSSGSIENPSYSVTTTDEIAKIARDKYDAEKAAKKLVNQPEGAVSSGLEVLASLNVQKTELGTVLPGGQNNPFLNPPTPTAAAGNPYQRRSYEESSSVEYQSTKPGQRRDMV